MKELLYPYYGLINQGLRLQVGFGPRLIVTHRLFEESSHKCGMKVCHSLSQQCIMYYGEVKA